MQLHARMGLLEGYLPTGKGRPWVPTNGTAFLDGTAAANIDDTVMGRAWSSWEVALVRLLLISDASHCLADQSPAVRQYSSLNCQAEHSHSHVCWCVARLHNPRRQLPASCVCFLQGGKLAVDLREVCRLVQIQHYNFFRHWREGSCSGYMRLPVFDLHTQGVQANLTSTGMP